MDYGENFEQAIGPAQSALDLMRERGIVPNPNNFTLWFHYFSGKYPDLKRALDLLLESGREIGDEQCAEIFHRFFTFEEEGAVVSDTADKVENQLSIIMQYLEQAEQGAEAYERALETFSGGMSAGSGKTDIKGLVNMILGETREMAERNNSLEEKLSASSQEILHLKDALEDMRHEAMTDALTGIPNRKLFDVELRRAAAGAADEGEPMCLLMLDIDFFKQFNDNHGHQIGDQVLRLLAATLTENIKGRDTAARYGGEEFAVVLPETGLDNAVSLAEKIRVSVSTKRIVNRKTGKDLGRITVSIGVAKLTAGEPLGRLIARADEALYLAKRTGRDRIASETELDAPQLEFDA